MNLIESENQKIANVEEAAQVEILFLWNIVRKTEFVRTRIKGAA